MGRYNGIKKIEEESLNDFFSRFETIQYSMNLADDSYEEPTEKTSFKAGRLEIRDTRKNSIVFRSGFLIHVTVHPRFRFAS